MSPRVHTNQNHRVEMGRPPSDIPVVVVVLVVNSIINGLVTYAPK